MAELAPGPEAVQFFSQGVRLAADLYRPAATPAPVVVLGAGWGGTKDRGLVQFASRLAASGFAALAIDYRGYGQSQGPENRLYPGDQADDLRAAVDYLRGHPDVDSRRIAILGVLTSAAAALEAAGEDESIRAVVGFFPFGDGEKWMRAQRGEAEWRAFTERLKTDRVARATSGTATLVDPNEILIRDAEGIEREEKSRAGSPRRAAWRLGLDSADAILAFRPVDHVDRIPPRAVMLVAVRNDVLMPFAEVERLYARLGEPKRLLVLDSIKHHDIYEPARLDSVMAQVAEFLTEAMP